MASGLAEELLVNLLDGRILMRLPDRVGLVIIVQNLCTLLHEAVRRRLHSRRGIP